MPRAVRSQVRLEDDLLCILFAAKTEKYRKTGKLN